MRFDRLRQYAASARFAWKRQVPEARLLGKVLDRTGQVRAEPGAEQAEAGQASLGAAGPDGL